MYVRPCWRGSAGAALDVIVERLKAFVHYEKHGAFEIVPGDTCLSLLKVNKPYRATSHFPRDNRSVRLI
jgi:hypothetical protein